MITLFIDTSLNDVSIALLKDNKIINKIVKSIPNEHSKYALPFIEEVLNKSNIKPQEVNKIMVVNGPGSFTGIRIGLTIAKIYAYILNIKVTLMSSLKCMALSTRGNYILSLIDARNDNYYMGLYDKDYNTIIKEHFTNIEEVNKIINEYKDIVIVKDKDRQLDIENIFLYYKDKEEVNSHMVLPNYLKLPQVLEKHD